MTRLLAAAFVLAAAAPALAQTPKPQPKVEYKQKTIIDITDDDVVEGTFARGEGDLIVVGGQVKHTSLIKPRVNFIPELIKSTERF